MIDHKKVVCYTSIFYFKDIMDLGTYLFTHSVYKKSFAALIPVHPNTITNWLKFRTSPRAHHIRRVEELTKRKVKFKDWQYFKEAQKKYG